MDTPMLRQYQQLKSEVPDAVLFFRLGDFYELFMEDAERVAKALNLTLTGRGKDDQRVPMCGVPHHAADHYIQKLIQEGYKVAVAEQVEDPALSKGLTRREIVRVMTPGMNIGGTLPPDESVYVAGLMPLKSNWGVALLELSTGTFQVGIIPDHAIQSWLGQVRPAERVGQGTDTVPVDVTLPLAPVAFAGTELAHHFGVAHVTAFGIDHLKAAHPIAWAVLQYATTFQKSRLPHLSGIAPLPLEGTMMMDPHTIAHLDLLPPSSGGPSLFSHLNRCQTAMGSRKLRQMIVAPLTHAPRIQARLDAVEALTQSPSVIQALKDVLRGVLDMERLVSRIVSLGSSPRDCLALCNSLTQALAVGPHLAALSGHPLFERHRKIVAHYSQPDSPVMQVLTQLTSAIVDDPPPHIREGHVIRDGYHAELDDLKASFASVKAWIVGLEEHERVATGIRVKVGYNKVFGYYIEVSQSARDRVPSHYQRKQTLTNAERYVTPELKEKESVLLSGESKQIAIEQSLFAGLVQAVAVASAPIQKIAGMLAELDVLVALADVAVTHHYVKPVMDPDDPHALHITNGRHPMVAARLGGRFIPNTVSLSHDHRFMLLTGPNMAGKSTLMRQCAVMVMMAQMGSFVPATGFRWGVVDRLFTRIGASDNLADGQSTFMVEMSETAAILSNATAHSLVLLDEIGRGTATYDGLSLAHAISGHLITQVKPRVFFATHYHELTILSRQHAGVSNHSMGIVESDGHIQFTYTLVSGPADSSFGIHVAQMAGIPSAVIESAKAMMAGLEKDGMTYLTQQVKQVTHAS